MAWVLKMDDATIESGLVHDFDASLSGIGQELGAGAYSMRLEPGLHRDSTGLSEPESRKKTKCRLEVVGITASAYDRPPVVWS